MADKIQCNKVQGNAPRQGKHAFPIPHDTQLRQIILEETSVEKDLGVYVDKDLNLNYHIQQGIAKANKLLGLIRRSMKYLNNESLKCLHTSLVRPHLEYGNVIWSPSLQSHINNLDKIQRRATKMIPEMQNKSYEERMESMRLPSLAYRRMRVMLPSSILH